MRLIRTDGSWADESASPPAPLVAVMEVAGGVLEWTIDEPDSPRLALHDIGEADWLWRVVGADAHARVLGEADGPGPLELTVDIGAVEGLRRLALGHWLRRWWPASARDGIVALDGALLDAELAARTARCEEFLDPDVLDAEVRALLGSVAAHLPRLRAAAHDDARVADLLEQCAELADDYGVPMSADAPAGRRSDYALAAGGTTRGERPGVVASGVASIAWSAVPPDVFDAAEDTLAWSVLARDQSPADAEPQVVAEIAAALATNAGSSELADGIAVRFAAGRLSAVGALDARGRARLPLRLSATAAWNYAWADAQVRVGPTDGESREVRERVRRYARRRIADPLADAYLAEHVAAADDF